MATALERLVSLNVKQAVLQTEKGFYSEKIKCLYFIVLPLILGLNDNLVPLGTDLFGNFSVIHNKIVKNKRVFCSR